MENTVMGDLYFRLVLFSNFFTRTFVSIILKSYQNTYSDANMFFGNKGYDFLKPNYCKHTNPSLTSVIQ